VPLTKSINAVQSVVSDASFLHAFFDMACTQRIGHRPADACENDLYAVIHWAEGVYLTTGIGCPEKISVSRSTCVSMTSIVAISAHEK
jgi:hypothetical protein